MRHLTTILCMLALIVAALPAQGGRPGGGRSGRRGGTQESPIPTVNRAEMTVQYYKIKNPREVDADDLLRAASSMFGRSFYVDDLPKTGRPLQNIFVVGESIAIFDTRDRVKAVLQALPEMEKAATPPAGKSEELYTETIQVQHVRVDRLLNALSAYRRNIQTNARARPGSRMASNVAPNINYHEESNTLVVRDTAENIAAIKNLVGRMDVPSAARQEVAVTFTCHILRASDKPDDSRLPRELVQNLQRLVGQDYFQDLGTTVLRARTNTHEIQARLTLEDLHQASLQMRNLRRSGSDIDINSVTFQIQKDPSQGSPATNYSIETSTSVTIGQYTVLGAFGKRPYFLVIRASVAE